MEHAIITRDVDLDAPPGEVWEALTDDEVLSSWFGADVTIDATPGGEGRFEERDGTVRRARVTDVEEGRRLSFTWWVDGDDDAPLTSVTFDLCAQGRATHLVVTEQVLLPGRVRASASTAPTVARGARAWASSLLHV